MLFVLATLFASFADYPLCSFFILINIFGEVYYEFKSYTYYFEKYLLNNWMFSKILFKIRNAFKQIFYKVLHKHQLLSYSGDQIRRRFIVLRLTKNLYDIINKRAMIFVSRDELNLEIIYLYSF